MLGLQVLEGAVQIMFAGGVRRHDEAPVGLHHLLDGDVGAAQVRGDGAEDGRVVCTAKRR